MIRGGGDFLLKLVARDTSHETSSQRLTGSPTVSRVQTLQTIHQPPSVMRYNGLTWPSRLSGWKQHMPASTALIDVRNTAHAQSTPVLTVVVPLL